MASEDDSISLKTKVDTIQVSDENYAINTVFSGDVFINDKLALDTNIAISHSKQDKVIRTQAAKMDVGIRYNFLPKAMLRFKIESAVNEFTHMLLLEAQF